MTGTPCPTLPQEAPQGKSLSDPACHESFKMRRVNELWDEPAATTDGAQHLKPEGWCNGYGIFSEKKRHPAFASTDCSISCRSTCAASRPAMTPVKEACDLKPPPWKVIPNRGAPLAPFDVLAGKRCSKHNTIVLWISKWEKARKDRKEEKSLVDEL